MDCDLLLMFFFCLFVSFTFFKRNILKYFSSFVRYLLILVFLNFRLFVFLQAKVSLKRLQNFLNSEELDPSNVQKIKCKVYVKRQFLN